VTEDAGVDFFAVTFYVAPENVIVEFARLEEDVGFAFAAVHDELQQVGFFLRVHRLVNHLVEFGFGGLGEIRPNGEQSGEDEDDEGLHGEYYIGGDEVVGCRVLRK